MVPSSTSLLLRNRFVFSQLHNFKQLSPGNIETQNRNVVLVFHIMFEIFHFVWNTSDMVTVTSPKMMCMVMIMMRTRKHCCKISSHLVRETLAETLHGGGS